MVDVERFWSKVLKTSTCWIWLGNDKNGCPIVKDKYPSRKKFMAARVAWKLEIGDEPKDCKIQSKCGNRSCIRPHPEHRYIEKFKVDKNLITKIREMWFIHKIMQKDIAIALGVGDDTVSCIIRNSGWVKKKYG